MGARLYVIVGSHACRTGMLLLEHKGIDYELVELPTGLHPLLLRLHGFSANPAPFRLLEEGSDRKVGPVDRLGTVPSLELDGRRVKTNGEIARLLDELRPDPPLFPLDPDRRRAVEEAETWGTEILQMTARRLALAAGARGRLANDGDDGRLGPLLWRGRRARRVLMHLPMRAFRVGASTEVRLLAALPAMLDRVDRWIEAGVLNGGELNAADLAIAPSLALLCYRPDLRPELEGRPLIQLVDRLLPEPASA
jgi:glutathione S-transferase